MQVQQNVQAQQYADVAARLDRLPPTRSVWRLVLLISLGGFFEFYDLFFTGYVAPGMVASGLFKPNSLGVFASLATLRVAGFGVFVFATFAGLWVGTLAFGQVADRFGRRSRVHGIADLVLRHHGDHGVSGQRLRSRRLAVHRGHRHRRRTGDDRRLYFRAGSPRGARARVLLQSSRHVSRRADLRAARLGLEGNLAPRPRLLARDHADRLGRRS